jgi:squalene-associated FAD-dependent desaturase
MSTAPAAPSPCVAIVGGGLAGLAAAVGLAGRGLRVELYEARRQLAGRAGSFRDPATGQWVDHCQHVSMGCCTNLADFCRRTGIADCFDRHRTLHFFARDGRRYDLGASVWLPAPLHLAPAFLRLGYLSLPERWGVARALWKMARLSAADSGSHTVGDWLREQGQTPGAVERFWAPVLVSALGETVEWASLEHARKVFVDGFMAARSAYEVEVPAVRLSDLYGERLERWLAEQGVAVHLSSAVREIQGTPEQVAQLVLEDGTSRPVDAAVVAVPWRRVAPLFAHSDLAEALPQLRRLDQIEAAPITGIHLWFDRPFTPLPHAVLLDALSQWVFNRGRQSGGEDDGYYYQVVISASRQLAGRDREAVLAEVLDDLARIWPAAREARLLRWRLVTEQAAVFSVRPGIEMLRPAQRTAIANLALAGDWTKTGWPATMEGAVRSGYLAAESILDHFGQPVRLLVPDLRPGLLARMLFRKPKAESGKRRVES